ncbi:MAG: AraC family transcriptional regulator [Eubacteriales bacterium]|nr:AraC family transcriptional regulator [Eubacteriales bacterium]
MKIKKPHMPIVNRSQLVNKDLLRFFALFLIVLLVPVAAFGYINNRYFIAIYRNEVINQNQKDIDKLVRDMDDQVRKMSSIAGQLSSLESVNERVMLGSFTSYYGIRRCLQGYNATNTFFTDMVFYNFNKPDTIYTTAGTYNRQLYKWYRLNGQSFSFADMLRQVDESHWFLPQDVSWYNATTSGSYEYVVRIPDSDHAFISFVIPVENMKIIAENQYSETFILNRNGALLYPAEKSDDLGLVQQLQSASNHTSSSQMIDEDRFVLSSVSLNTGITIVRLISKSILLKDVLKIRNLLILSIFVILIVGCLIAFVLSCFSYKPIKKLVVLTRNMFSDMPTNLNGLDRAQYAIKHLDEKYKNLEREAQKSKLLLMLIYGRLQESDDIRTASSEHGLVFNSSHYRVLYVTDVNHTSYSDDTIYELCSSYLGNYFETYAVDPLRSIGLIFVIGYNEPTADQLQDIMQGLLALISTRQDGKIKIAVGSESDRIEFISESYQSAVRCHHKYDHREEHRVMIHDFEPPDKEDFIYPQIEFGLLRESIIQSDPEKLKLLTEIIVEMIRQHAGSQYTSMLLGCNLINTYLEAMHAASLGASERLSQLQAQMKSIDVTDVQAVIQVVNDLLGYVQHILLKNAEQAQPDSLSLQIVAYIKNHRTDPELNVTAVADYFDMSISNVSHQFKQQTGTNISDCIATVKMTYAEELLRDSKETVNQVANKVGYNNPSNFIRKFKAYKKMTPHEYRLIYQSETAEQDKEAV